MSELTKRLCFSFGSKLPMVYQTETAECGLSCLAMVAGYHGFQADLLTLRKQFSLSLKGSRLQDLVAAGKKLRLLSRALKIELNDLKYLKTPCILHWNLDHFVVLKKVQNKMVVVHDPAIGIVKYEIAKVSQYFTGIALEFTPAADFTKKKAKAKLKISDLWSSITGLKLPLVQIVAISFALEVFVIISPLLLQFVMDGVLIQKDIPLLYLLAAGFGLLTLIKVAASLLRSWIILFLANVLNMQLVANLMHHLFKLPLEYFQKRHMGDIVSRFGSLSIIQAKISTDFIEGIVDGILVIITLMVMVIYSCTLTAVVVIALLFYVSFRVGLYSPFRRFSQESLIASAKESSVFMEGIRAILPIKIFGKEEERENVWQNCCVAKLNANIRPLKLGLLLRFSQDICSGLEYIIIIIIGATLVMQATLSLGMLMAYFAFRQQFVDKAQSLINKIFDYKMLSLELERIADIAMSEPEKDLAKDINFSKTIHGAIRVKNLSFRYSDQDPYIFTQVNFAITAGEAVVLVGPSGCGKTTLLKMLMRLLLPVSGEIFIDDIDINKMGLHNYRSQIAAVMQEDMLLSGTIGENICFFDQNPDFNRIYAVAKTAAIHDDIMSMPMAYHSLVGDMGTILSGGQKQRVLLARALYSQPKILFLDEATSHLDLATETIINQHIKQINVTRVIVAHRQETINMADRVIDLLDCNV